MKSLEESVENYVASVPMAMWKYKKYLMKTRNFEQKYAIEKAIHYGKKMLEEGVSETIPPELAAVLFREFADINIAMANWLKPDSKNQS